MPKCVSDAVTSGLRLADSAAGLADYRGLDLGNTRHLPAPDLKLAVAYLQHPRCNAVGLERRGNHVVIHYGARA